MNQLATQCGIAIGKWRLVLVYVVHDTKAKSLIISAFIGQIAQ